MGHTRPLCSFLPRYAYRLQGFHDFQQPVDGMVADAALPDESRSSCQAVLSAVSGLGPAFLQLFILHCVPMLTFDAEFSAFYRSTYPDADIISISIICSATSLPPGWHITPMEIEDNLTGRNIWEHRCCDLGEAL